MTYELDELPHLLETLYSVVSRLEELAPGRKFTPDGHLVGSIGEAVAAYSYDLELLPASVKQHDAKTRDGRLVQIKLTQGAAVALSYTCDHLLVLQLARRTGFVEIYNGPGDPVWEMIADEADVGRQRQIRVSTLRALASPREVPGIPRVRDFPAILPKALEAVGADFQPADASGTEAAPG